MTTKSNSTEPETGELEPRNVLGKRLFPSALILVACDHCSEPRGWPLTCGHDYNQKFSAEYRHVNTVTELERERDALREACKKALTCASLNSDVRALIRAALGETK
jgi:hypothetical protein